MDVQKFKRAKAIEQKNKERLLKINPRLTEDSGIYFLTREDEQGFRYAYIGQAAHILTRLAQHLSGYQHIDLSLKKHGLYSADKLHGWRIDFCFCELEGLDEQERYWIKIYADMGYQLRNKTSGGQGEGEAQIGDYKPARGYRDGLRQGRRSLARELSRIAQKHLTIAVRADKEGNQVSQKQYEKFLRLMEDGE